MIYVQKCVRVCVCLHQVSCFRDVLYYDNSRRFIHYIIILSDRSIGHELYTRWAVHATTHTDSRNIHKSCFNSWRRNLHRTTVRKTKTKLSSSARRTNETRVLVCTCVGICAPKVRIERWSREDIVFGGVYVQAYRYIFLTTDELITRPFGERIAPSAQQ